MGRGSPVSGRAITPIQTGQSAAASHMIRPRFAISFGRLAFPMEIGTGSPSASAINGRPICALMPLVHIFDGGAPINETSQTGDVLIRRYSDHIDIVSLSATLRF